MGAIEGTAEVEIGDRRGSGAKRAVGAYVGEVGIAGVGLRGGDHRNGAAGARLGVLGAGQVDGRGNLNIGIKEQLIFPEIEYDKVDKIRGMDVTIVTTARTDEHARELLRLMGFPLREAAGADA